ncbi:MAG: helix-turn-helix domain-containing protein [Alicyclobacillus sp.]|nr:helix-turn-helix domain-containing protein [Alicyclobacillus sp.]
MYRLLIAEDEAPIRKGIQNMVNWASIGVSVCGSASDGMEALELARQTHPHILLTDVRMPRMNGLELISNLLSLGIRPVSIVLSGFSDFEFAKQSIRLGVFDYLIKPCRPAEIQRVVQQACERIDHVDQAANPESEDPRAAIEHTPPVASPPVSPSMKPGASPQMHRTVRRAIQLIEQEYNTNLTLESVAKRVYVSTTYLSTLFKQEVGINFLDYLHQYRIEKAKAMLLDPTLKIQTIARAVGYFDESHFNRTFKKWTGVSPSQYQNGLE